MWLLMWTLGGGIAAEPDPSEGPAVPADVVGRWYLVSATYTLMEETPVVRDEKVLGKTYEVILGPEGDVAVNGMPTEIRHRFKSMMMFLPLHDVEVDTWEVRKNDRGLHWIGVREAYQERPELRIDVQWAPYADAGPTLIPEDREGTPVTSASDFEGDWKIVSGRARNHGSSRELPRIDAYGISEFSWTANSVTRNRYLESAYTVQDGIVSIAGDPVGHWAVSMSGDTLYMTGTRVGDAVTAHQDIWIELQRFDPDTVPLSNEVDYKDIRWVFKKRMSSTKGVWLDGKATCNISATMGRNGFVKKVEATGCDPLLAKVAEGDIKKWKAEPRLIDGKATVFTTHFVMRYRGG